MDVSEFLFRGWEHIARTLLVGVLAYAALIVAVRVSGKRTLSKMNAFDLIVTVALGSTLASILLSPDVALAEGVVALFLLVALQWLIAFSSSRSKLATRVVKSDPQLLAYQGRLLEDALKAERFVADEVLAAVRSHGHGSLDDVEAVVLETDGSLSVVSSGQGHRSALASVEGAPPSR